MLLPLGVIFENVEHVLGFDFIIQSQSMCDLIFFFDQIELLLDCDMVLVPILAHLEEHLNHVLHTLVDIRLV